MGDSRDQYLILWGLVKHLEAGGALKTARIIKAFRKIDRVDFVPPAKRKLAYLDEALPIGCGQTISQPTVVALMLEWLGPRSGEKILDVGSGSGWTTALLAALVGQKGRVWGVERVPELVRLGRENLAKYKFTWATIESAGAMLGLPSRAPFDKILVSAATEELPQELLAQLKTGGLMVIPVGHEIWQVKKISEAKTEIQKFYGFAFVPLIHGEAE